MMHGQKASNQKSCCKLFIIKWLIYSYLRKVDMFAFMYGSWITTIKTNVEQEEKKK